MGLVTTVGLAAIQVRVNTRVELVQQVGVVRTSGLLGTTGAGGSVLTAANTSASITVRVDTRGNG